MTLRYSDKIRKREGRKGCGRVRERKVGVLHRGFHQMYDLKWGSRVQSGPEGGSTPHLRAYRTMAEYGTHSSTRSAKAF